MPEIQLQIEPVSQPIRAAIRPPGSKSITNRALVCAALAHGQSTLRGALASDDTRVMIDALHQLGIDVSELDGGRRLDVWGCGGQIPARAASIFVGNSGTTMRFLTPLCALGRGQFTLDGVPRMRERPIGDLLTALQQLGVNAYGTVKPDFPPVMIDAAGLPGGTTSVAGSISSQFLTGLLMAAPCARGAMTIVVEGRQVSVPYVDMTLQVMREFGARVERDASSFVVADGHAYHAREYTIEPDASAASYFWAAAAVTGGQVEVEGLNQQSLQGDVRFCECLQRMGCRVAYGTTSTTVVGGPLTAIEADMGEITDTVQTLAVVALFAKGTTRIRNVKHIRFKETDRLAALAAELRKLGAHVVEHDDGLDITPGKWSPASIATYNDHRMAMSFAIAGLVKPGLVIEEPACVAKTYPEFFVDLDTLRT